MSRPRIKHPKPKSTGPVSLPVLEARFNAYVKQSAEIIGRLGQNQADLDLAIDAIIRIVGKDLVEEKVAEIRAEKDKNAYEITKKKIDEAIAEGKVVVQSKLETDADLIEFNQTGTDGKILGGGNVIVYLDGLKKEYQDIVREMNVGETKEIDGRGTFTLVAVYGEPKAETTEQNS